MLAREHLQIRKRNNNNNKTEWQMEYKACLNILVPNGQASHLHRTTFDHAEHTQTQQHTETPSPFADIHFLLYDSRSILFPSHVTQYVAIILSCFVFFSLHIHSLSSSPAIHSFVPFIHSFIHSLPFSCRPLSIIRTQNG